MAEARRHAGVARVPLPPVRGAVVDDETRCIHWSSPLDVVALRFWCCAVWYPCFECHEDDADHPARPRPRSAWDEPSALCGVCGHVMTTPEYRASDACSRCAAPFNPGCRTHAHLYFAD
ncbi:CHY zinc finger protein [Luteimicrobium sp. NPDC057192]|uniref:CHY zinc finger protein n=1 Tax=Luteimicrobium sp. NPDC057192 TaxID=3346042 RepID=UPI0036320070